jgi:organic radical activating enzyme
MVPDRKDMYKMPWSSTDNQAGWIEVTDTCNLLCSGCYRNKIEGHKSLDEIKNEIALCSKITNGDVMVIAGGEPLIYPHIFEVVEFISSLGIKPLILSNGLNFTHVMAQDFKKAGLSRIHFHIDSSQKRTCWENKTESELNELRQYYADLLWGTKGIQCGFHMTVRKETLNQIPSVIEWYRRNMHKVQHLSLIALRGIPYDDSIEYFAGEKTISEEELINCYKDKSEIEITTEQLYEQIQKVYKDYIPSAYINGEPFTETNKQLIFANIGSAERFYGTFGKLSVEMSQVFNHLFRGKYLSYLANPKIGQKVFLLSMFDKQVRKACVQFFRYGIKNPLDLFRKVYIQSLILQQPIEFMNGEKNVCDHCINPMIYKGRLINPCQLDEFRLYGGMLKSRIKINSINEI